MKKRLKLPFTAVMKEHYYYYCYYYRIVAVILDINVVVVVVVNDSVSVFSTCHAPLPSLIALSIKSLSIIKCLVNAHHNSSFPPQTGPVRSPLPGQIRHF